MGEGTLMMKTRFSFFCLWKTQLDSKRLLPLGKQTIEQCILLVKFCSSEFKPMRLNHKQWVQNPIAVLDGNYPSGTECYYQVEPLDDDCHTVLHFQQNPFELKEECETWAIEVTKTMSCRNKYFLLSKVFASSFRAVGPRLVGYVLV